MRGPLGGRLTLPNMNAEPLPPPLVPLPVPVTEGRPRWPLVIGVVVGAVGLFGAGFVVGASSDSESTRDSVDAGPVSDDEGDRPSAARTAPSVDADDIAIDYVVLDEDCFDSAGSLMEVELSPARAASSNLSLEDFSDLTLLVTFDITNTDGGVTRGSFEIVEGRYASQTELLSFPRCNTNPRITVTSVTER